MACLLLESNRNLSFFRREFERRCVSGGRTGGLLLFENDDEIDRVRIVVEVR
jgi:hypothetical protein